MSITLGYNNIVYSTVRLNFKGCDKIFFYPYLFWYSMAHLRAISSMIMS